MFRWCSYCNHFLGEAAPFESLEFTHGVCASCRTGRAFERDLTAAKAASEFVRDLIESARLGRAISVPEILERGARLGLGRAELFLAIIQPALIQIGSDFEEGKISVAREHAFSEFVIDLFDRVETERPDSRPPLVHLVSAPGNGHSLGLRMLAITLQDNGIPCALVEGSTLSPLELVEKLRAQSARVLGFSVSMPQQRLAVLACLRELQLMANDEIFVVLGGQGVRSLNGNPFPVFLDPQGMGDRVALFARLVAAAGL